jgi:AcrR family transcriptional regulator
VKTNIVSLVSSAKSAGKSDLRSRVVDAAGKLFLKRGFFRVTSDDIAADLGISKATLYRCFKSKEEILMAVIDSLRTMVMTGIEAILGDSKKGFLEKLAGLAVEVGRMFPVLNSEMANDIRKSLPHVWKEIEDFRRRKILINFRILIEEGIREGAFKQDVELDLIVEMYVALIEGFLNPDVLFRKGRRAEDVFKAIIDVFFSGILTDKARNEFSKTKAYFFRFEKEALR